jgi:hypothetical protein
MRLVKGVTVVAVVLMTVGVAHAGGLVRWRGLALEGASLGMDARAVARAQAVTATQVAISVKQLGWERVSAEGSAADAEADARCARAGAKIRCTVRVVELGEPRTTVERALDLDDGDGETIAQMVALVVTDLLARGERAERVVPPQPREPAPPPVAAGPLPPPKSSAPSVSVTKAPILVGPTRFAVGIEGQVAFGFSGEPILGGVGVRGTWGKSALRAGGLISIVGGGARLGGYDLSFVRVALGPRVGAGWRRGRIGLDCDFGPHLVVLSAQAGGVGAHTMVTGAAAGGLQALVRIVGGFAVWARVEGQVAFSRLRVIVGDSEVGRFDLGALGLGIGVGYVE